MKLFDAHCHLRAVAKAAADMQDGALLSSFTEASAGNPDIGNVIVHDGGRS